MEKLQNYLEEDTKLVDTIKFMIADNMFDKEFILTAILEYLENNNKHENK